ncbi:hypothetical protein BDP27DRAFT_834262 [Rhodocollybia butyracea]|uniref:Uncharacterized protein n=1 Tax=Rhodocollybia butyracea TaxID=206335 RepID=A0A9P5PS79_9AGAR|nr:hypothetical protein BDP27DRAFT_834262 [Rhodocollybia butyracea]
MCSLTCATVILTIILLMVLAPRGFADSEEEEDEDSGVLAPNNDLKSLQQLKESGNDYYGLVPKLKRNDPDIVGIIEQLKDTDPQIEERMRVAVKLWKARYPTDTSDVDIDELLKEFQHQVSTGEPVEPTLRRLDELQDLNRKKI